METSRRLLETLTQADSVPGFEDEMRTLFATELASVGNVTRDRMGGVICERAGRSATPRIMLDCHLDEIGFIIQHVSADGFLKFLPLGGWWTHILPAQRVRVHGSGRTVIGVIGSTPPHFLPPERRGNVLEIRDMFIDVGAENAGQVAEWGIRPGSWAVPYSPFTTMASEDLVMAKAFDNRVGCALCIETMQRLDDSHPNTILAAGSAQEEVGLRGARATAHLIDPDVAIVLEGPPADDTPGMRPDESQGRLGGGVQIRVYDPSMIANPRLVDLVIGVATEAGIAHQVTVRSSGGTNAGSIHVHGAGVPSVVLGVPARYIHSHASIIHLGDYAAALDLTLALCNRLDADTVAGLTA